MPLLGKFCGDTVPAPVKSSQNAIYIKFYSDGLTPKSGFALKWQTFERQSPLPGPPPSPDGNKGIFLFDYVQYSQKFCELEVALGTSIVVETGFCARSG